MTHLNAQATPSIYWAVMDDPSGPTQPGVEAGLFFIDHLMDAAACTLVGFMFQKAHKSLMALKSNQ